MAVVEEQDSNEEYDDEWEREAPPEPNHVQSSSHHSEDQIEAEDCLSPLPMRKKNITHPRQSSFKLSQSNKSMRGLGSTETNN